MAPADMTRTVGESLARPRPRLDLFSGVFDQGLSSLTNFAPQFTAAVLLTVGGFADVSIALLISLLSVEIIRAITGEVLLTMPALAGDRAFVRRAVSTALSMALLLATVIAVGGLVLARGDTRTTVVVAAFVTPFVAVQDVWRFVGFSSNDLSAVITSDGLWCVFLAAGYAPYLSFCTPTAAGLVLVWGVAALPSALIMSARGGRPGLRNPVLWFRESDWRAVRYCAEYLADRGSSSIGLLVAGAVSGAIVVSTVRGCQLLAGPVLVLVNGLSFVLAPQAVRVFVNAPEMFGRWIVVRSISLAAAGSTVVLVITALPASLGTKVLGDIWPEAVRLRVALAVYIAAGSISVVLRLGVRAKGGERSSLRMRRALFPLLLGTPVLGAATGGATGCMWGVSVATSVVLATWVYVFLTT